MFLKIETDDGVSGWGEPVIEGGAVGVDHVRPADTRPGQCPDDLRGQQLPAMRISGRKVLQIDAGATGLG